MSTISDALVHAYDEKFNSVHAVAIQLGVMGAVSVIALVVFSVLRFQETAYQPKLKYYERKAPPAIGDGILAWMVPLIKLNEDDIADVIGLDSTCYLRFTRMCRNFLFSCAILGSLSLIPINIIYNISNVNSTNRNILSMMTIQNTREVWLWSHVGATYAFTTVGMWFVHSNYTTMVKLRWKWFRVDYCHTLSARSLMVTCVHKRYQSDFGLAYLLKSLKIPYPTTAVHIGRRFAALRSLIEDHTNAVKSLESVLTKFLKDPNKLPKRPTRRVNGTRVDAIDHLTAKIRLLENKIEKARDNIGERVAENFGFASFARTAYAQIVGRVLETKKQRGSHFALAPPPKDIIWENIALEDGARMRSKIIGGVVSLTLMLIYTVPIFFVSLLSNLSAIAPDFPFLDSWSDSSPFLFAAFAGIVPPVLTLLLQSFLPICFRWIVSYEGAVTYTQRDRIVLSRYAAFIFISQFVLFSIFGWGLEVILKELAAEGRIALSADDIWRYVRFLPTSLHDTYMRQSTYWLTISLTKIATTFIDLTQFLPLSRVWLRTIFTGRTPRDIREATMPRTFDYPVYYANNLLLLAVGIAYSPISPLVTLGCAAAFLASTCVDKYLLIYVNTTKRESGGRSWRVGVNRFLFSLLAMQLLMLMAIAVQMGWIYSLSLIPSMIIVVIFKITLVRKFDNAFRWYIPDAQEIEDSEFYQADATADRLERRFGHPSLHEKLISPMLHKSVEHLLPLVYKGRIDESTKPGEVRIESATAGGIKFQMLETRDLIIDRATYLRHRDEDNMSLSSSRTLNQVGTNSPSFDDARRKSYLSAGPQRSSTQQDIYELETMLPRQSYDSSRTLLRPEFRDRSSSSSYMTQTSTARPSFDYSILPGAFETEPLYPAPHSSPRFLQPENRTPPPRFSPPLLQPPLLQPPRRSEYFPPQIDRPAAPRRHRYSEGDARGAGSRY